MKQEINRTYQNITKVDLDHKRKRVNVTPENSKMLSDIGTDGMTVVATAPLYASVEENEKALKHWKEVEKELNDRDIDIPDDPPATKMPKNVFTAPLKLDESDAVNINPPLNEAARSEIFTIKGALDLLLFSGMGTLSDKNNGSKIGGLSSKVAIPVYRQLSVKLQAEIDNVNDIKKDPKCSTLISIIKEIHENLQNANSTPLEGAWSELYDIATKKLKNYIRRHEIFKGCIDRYLNKPTREYDRVNNVTASHNEFFSINEYIDFLKTWQKNALTNHWVARDFNGAPLPILGMSVHNYDRDSQEINKSGQADNVIRIGLVQESDVDLAQNIIDNFNEALKSKNVPEITVNVEPNPNFQVNTSPNAQIANETEVGFSHIARIVIPEKVMVLTMNAVPNAARGEYAKKSGDKKVGSEDVSSVDAESEETSMELPED